MRQLLYGMRECGLKNDALLYTFYELVGARYRSREPYAILVFHDRYDVPVKASDKERQGESEEVYEYLIGAVAPMVGEYGASAAGLRVFISGICRQEHRRYACCDLFRRIRETQNPGV